jgi:prepilin-type N-terminal cleavage/methylation domain-containing protein
MHSKGLRSAFTLIELLVVIAIIAVLAIVVVLTLNPAALLQQSRDANRVSDMTALANALNLYSSDQSSAPGFNMGSSTVIYVSIPDPTATSTAGDQCQGLSLISIPSGYSYHCAASSTFRNVDGTGWIPVDLLTITSGSPIGNLPIDPTNTTSTGLYYSYATNGVQWAVWATPESAKYTQSSQANPIPGYFSQGSNISLVIPSYNIGLVGWWPLNEGSGSVAIDSSANNATGTWFGFQGGTSGYYSAGYDQAWAGVFGGTNTYVSISNMPTLHTASGFTVSAWINQSALHNYNAIVTRTASNEAAPFDSYVNSGGFLSFFVGNGTASQAITATLSNTNSWVLVTMLYNGSSMSIYKNGVLVSGPTAVTVPVGDTSQPVRIGSRNDGATMMQGSIEGVRIYNYALSSTQIQALYNLGR